MKKVLNLLLVFALVFTLTSCKDDTSQNPTIKTCEEGFELVDNDCTEIESYLEIFYLNDFHGALESGSDEIGIAYIANFIKTKKAEKPNNVLFVVGGDILQGSALSNYYSGLSTINLFNEMGLDAFTIGNHEFDWGIDTILQYADGDETNGEANFPFLGANIFHEGTNDMLDGVDPYTIVEKGTHKVGIIGTIGFGLEHSIAESKIAGYDFGDPMDQIEYYAQYLRTVENCDVVIVVAHDSGYINSSVAALTGDYKIDAVFNGHSHSEYTNTGGGIAQIQSGSSGEYIGSVRINFDETGISGYDLRNISKYQSALLSVKDPVVDELLETYILETADLFDSEIIVSNDYYTATDLSRWIAELIGKSTNSAISFHNYGGTRTNIDNGEAITLGLLYEIWPFDNVIKTVELTGAEINALMSDGGLAYSTEIDIFDANTTYLVATNDYVFDKPDNPFIYGDNPVNTGIIMRDLAQQEMILQSNIYQTFSIENNILTGHSTNEEESTVNP